MLSVCNSMNEDITWRNMWSFKNFCSLCCNIRPKKKKNDVIIAKSAFNEWKKSVYTCTFTVEQMIASFHLTCNLKSLLTGFFLFSLGSHHYGLLDLHHTRGSAAFSFQKQICESFLNITFIQSSTVYYCSFLDHCNPVFICLSADGLCFACKLYFLSQFGGKHWLPFVYSFPFRTFLIFYGYYLKFSMVTSLIYFYIFL